MREAAGLFSSGYGRPQPAPEGTPPHPPRHRPWQRAATREQQGRGRHEAALEQQGEIGQASGPAHSVRTGKTPVLDPSKARQLLDSIDVSTPAGLRDRALIALMVHIFAR